MSVCFPCSRNFDVLYHGNLLPRIPFGDELLIPCRSELICSSLISKGINFTQLLCETGMYGLLNMLWYEKLLMASLFPITGKLLLLYSSRLNADDSHSRYLIAHVTCPVLVRSLSLASDHVFKLNCHCNSSHTKDSFTPF